MFFRQLLNEETACASHLFGCKTHQQLAVIAFQAALAAGARLGDGAWGGAHAQLTTGQRLASAVSVVFYAGAIFIVRRRAAGREERRYRWAAWVLAGIFTLAAFANLASGSPWENALLAPVAFVLAVLCVIVARTPDRRAAAR